MKVSELISQLQEQNPNDNVHVMLSDMSVHNFEIAKFVGDNDNVYIDLHCELNNNTFTYSRCQ